jgi:hypothetical protein
MNVVLLMLTEKWTCLESRRCVPVSIAHHVHYPEEELKKYLEMSARHRRILCVLALLYIILYMEKESIFV